MLARILAPALAALLVAGVGVLDDARPAQAAMCADGGVSVVVDRGGGSTSTSCAAGGGGDSAAALFGAAGHVLERVRSHPGAVCRVDGAPATSCERMPPANRYWALYWSDGSSGWIYASQGVDTQQVPEGGSVAFAWQSSSTRRAPAVAPARSQPAPSPSANPSGTGRSGGRSGAGPSAAPGPAPSAAPSPGSPSPTASAAGPTQDGRDARDPGAEQGTDERVDPATGRDRESSERGADRGERAERGERGGADRGDRAGRGPEAGAAAETGAPVGEADAVGQPAVDAVPWWATVLVLLGLLGLAVGTAVVRRRRAG